MLKRIDTWKGDGCQQKDHVRRKQQGLQKTKMHE
jgi:hypothetical protein